MGMPKPQNDERKNTTVGISKALKQRIRQCAIPASGRKGYEKDEEVIERIVDFYHKNNTVEPEPHSTFV